MKNQKQNLGILLYRYINNKFEIYIIRYPDNIYTLIHGKCHNDEKWHEGARRIVFETTGYELQSECMFITDITSQDTETRYFTFEVTERTLHIERSKEEGTWIDVTTASDILSLPVDREVLNILVVK